MPVMSLKKVYYPIFPCEIYFLRPDYQTIILKNYKTVILIFK